MKLKDISNAVGRSTPLTIDERTALYHRLVAGDQDARQEMIEGSIALAIFQTEAFLRSNPQYLYYRDDLLSAALNGLCEAVDTMQTRKNVKEAKAGSYILRTIDHHLSRASQEAGTIVVFQRAQDRARATGNPLVMPRYVSTSAAIGVADPHSDDQKRHDELDEEIRACCRDDIDRKIVLFRLDGQSDIQIAKALHISQPQVSRRKKAIEQRLLARCPEFKETERAKAKRLARKK